MFHPFDAVLFYTWLGAYTAAMPHELVWIEDKNFQGFGSSECNWVFKISGELAGESRDEMKRKYEAQRDKEFAPTFVSGTQGPRGQRLNRSQQSLRTL